MAKKPTQEAFDVMKIPLVEKWADTFNEKRDLIAGLKAELKNAKMKLKESMHKYQAKLDRQESPKGEGLLIYVRGDYRVILKTTEDVAVKIGADSQEPPVTADDGADDAEGNDLEVGVPE